MYNNVGYINEFNRNILTLSTFNQNTGVRLEIYGGGKGRRGLHFLQEGGGGGKLSPFVTELHDETKSHSCSSFTSLTITAFPYLYAIVMC